MLVLSRRQGESIIIGGEIVVTIVEVRGGQVRLGIDAPRSVDVHREEIYREVCRENLAATQSANTDSSLLRTRVSDRAEAASARPPVTSSDTTPKDELGPAEE